MYETWDEAEQIASQCIQNYADKATAEQRTTAVQIIQGANDTELPVNRATLDDSQLLDSATYTACEGNVNVVLEYGRAALPQAAQKSRLSMTSHGHYAPPVDGAEPPAVLFRPSLVAFNVNLWNGQVDRLTDYDRRVNIIVVLRNRGIQLMQFLASLKREIAISGLDVFVSICDFHSIDINVALQLASSGIPHRLIQVGHGNFSKVVGLRKLIASTRDDDVIFIADVDYYMPARLLLMTLKYTKRGASVYMPIPWYSGGDDVHDEDLQDGTVKSELCAEVGLPAKCALSAYVLAQTGKTVMQMPSELGFAVGGYGPISMYKSDYQGLDAFNLEIFGHQHGYEDTDAAYRLWSCNMLVVRHPLDGFAHLPHSSASAWNGRTTEAAET